MNDVVTEPNVGVGFDRAFRSLFWKYFAAIGGSVLLVLPATALTWAWLTFHDHMAAIERLQQEQARAAADKIGEFIRQIEAQLTGTVLLPWNSSSADERRLDGLRLMRQLPAIAELAMLDERGFEQLRMSRLVVDTVRSGIDRSGEPLYRLAREHSVFRGPVYFHRESEPHMVISVAGPRTGSGVSLATINLKLIWDLISRINTGAESLAYAVDATGRLIAHPDQSLVLKGTNLAQLPQVRRALALSQSGRFNEVDVDETGRKVLAASAPVSNTGWIMLIQAPLSVALAPIYSSLFATLLIMFAALGIAIVTSLVLARRMFTPIQALETGAEYLGSGALGHRIDVRTGDELQRLAECFNSMAAKLEQSYATLETKVDERTQQLQGAMLAKSRFLAAASHDLRQPLHALGLFAEQLSVTTKEAERKKVETRIQAAIANMNELFGSLLEVSRLDAGVVTSDPKSFPVSHLLRRIDMTFGDAAVLKGIELRIIDSGEWILSDPILLERILNNLVSNAVRYTERGRVLVGCRRCGSLMRIEVWDTGPGIPVDQQQLVFSEFYRGAEAGQGIGLGLGLSIVDRLSRLLAHQLELQSAAGVGTRFCITVPRTNKQSWPLQIATDAPAFDLLRGKVVVVIDDDELSLDAISSLLRFWSCNVIGGKSLDDIASEASSCSIDAIISDFHLSSMRGTEAISALRKNSQSAIPAVLISGDTDKAIATAAEDFGCLFLHKPVQPMALRAGLSALFAAGESREIEAG